TTPKSARVTREDLYHGVQEGGVKELAVVLKADAQGSIEALQDALEKLDPALFDRPKSVFVLPIDTWCRKGLKDRFLHEIF
ncbi:MAG: hypothetical protein ACE5J1_06885, partial [Nitrospiria bacterium]